MNVYFLHINTVNYLHDELNVETYLSHKTLERLEKSTNPIRRKYILGGAILFDYVIKDHSISKNTLYVSTNKYGKPLLNQGYYNLSHSKEWIMFVYYAANIGVDIEKLSKVNFHLAKHFLTIEEYDYIIQLPQEKRSEYFFTTWTFKESYVKCLGTSLLKIRKKINAPKEVNYFIKESIKLGNEIYYYIRGKLDDYVWCIFSESLPYQVNTRIVTFEEIVESLDESD